MKHADLWKPSKFVLHNGVLRGSRNPKDLHPSSRLIADAVARRYQEAFALYATGRLLDLGCGTVPFYAAYRPYIRENTCVDWGNSLHNRRYLDQEADLTRPLPFEDDSFDTILLSDVLEHIPNPADLWQEMARLLRPGGKLLLNVPFMYYVHEEPHDYYRYTGYALRRFAEGVGLRLLTMESVGGLPEVMADLLSKSLHRIPLIGVPLVATIQGATAAFVRLKPGRALSVKTGARFPLGYFMVAQK